MAKKHEKSLFFILYSIGIGELYFDCTAGYRARQVNEYSYLVPIQGDERRFVDRLARLTSGISLYRDFIFLLKEFAMSQRQTTIINSGIIQKNLGIIPGMNLIAWCEDKTPNDGKSFSVFLEVEGGEYCLYLEVELHDGYPPVGDYWTLMKREDVLFILRYDDPEYEGLNYLVSQDPYWIEGIKKQPNIAA